MNNPIIIKHPNANNNTTILFITIIFVSAGFIASLIYKILYGYLLFALLDLIIIYYLFYKTEVFIYKNEYIEIVRKCIFIIKKHKLQNDKVIINIVDSPIQAEVIEVKGYYVVISDGNINIRTFYFGDKSQAESMKSKIIQLLSNTSYA